MRLTDKACILDITGKNNEFFYIKDNQNITDDEIFNKLGQYEDIDEDPAHLDKIKQVLEIIKTKKDVEFEIDYDEEHDFWAIFFTAGDYRDIFASGYGKENYALLREVLL